MTSFFKPKADEPKKDDDDKDKDKKDAPKDGKPATDAKKVDEKDAAKICNMKRGDYMIHLMVEQAKELKIAEGKSIDPIVEIKILGERKFTTALKGINNLTVADWSEHVFYEKKNVEEEQLAMAKVEIKLLDKGFFKDALIGYYEFDLTYIYQQENHSLMHKWIIMSNPEGEDFGEVTGYLKISMTITGDGDNQIAIEDDPEPEVEKFISPPTIKPEFYQLYIRFFAAQNIVPLDTGVFDGDGKIDAYVRFQYRSTKLKSKVLTQKKGGEIHWNQEFLVPAQLPIMGGNLNFKVFDEDTLVDEIVGSFALKSKDIIGDLNGKYFWKNIYGSPLDCSGKHTDRMNENPLIGSLWKGRILMQVYAEVTEKPVLLVRNIDVALINAAAIHLAPKQYQFAIQIMAGIALPENHKFQVQVRVAEMEFTTDDKKTAVFEENGKVISSYNRYQQNLHEGKPHLQLPYIDVSDIGTVFVYLIRESKFTKKQERVCFTRLHVTDFLDPSPDVKWLELERDRAIDTIKDDYKAGIIGIRMSIQDVTRDGPLDLTKQEAWCIKLQRRPPTFLVRAYCFQARDLPAADENGSSDPFIRITDTGKAQDTRVIFDNVNPIFYQALDLGYEANREEDMPPIIIDLFDMDVNTVTKNSVEFLSRAVLSLEDILPFSTTDAIVTPKWYPLRFKKGGPQCGEVLMSFAVVEGDYMFKTPVAKVNLPVEAGIKMREFNVMMNILGLRHLQTAGILPVKKAFILFNIKSMVSPDVGNAVENIKTEPSAPGPDPTLNTLIEFGIELPTDELYCPRMSCTVFDSVCFGLSQPIIGTFVIPIGALITELADERKREVEALENVIQRLKEITSSETFIVALRASLRQKDGMREIMTPKSQDKDMLNKSQKFRMNLVNKMKASKQKEGISVQIQDTDADEIQEEQPLLGKDADEEVRMSERVAEAEQNSLEGQQQNQNNLIQMMVQGQAIGRLNSRTGSNTLRTGSGNIRLGSQSMLSPVNNRFDPDLKEQLMEQDRLLHEKAERDIETARAKAEAEFLETANVTHPKYKFDEKMQIDREVNPPPPQLFLGLGWDEDKDTGRRHYRRWYNNDLEKITSVLQKQSPFNQYDLKRGQSRGASKSIWQSLTGNVKEDESGQTSTEQIVGRFKAVIEVEIKTEKAAYKVKKVQLVEEIEKQLILLAKSRGIFDFDLNVEKLDTIEGRKEIEQQIEPLGVSDLDIVQKLADIESDEILRRMLLHENQCIVRVYMISGYNLASRDIGGDSDPYLKLSIGSKVFSDRENYVLDNPEPKFNKHFDFETIFPGCPLLQIDAFDYDELFGDDLIGTTCVDLEDRYFMPEWRALKDKPIEYRQIFHPSSAVSQGVLKMWIEINKVKVDPQHVPTLYDIRDRPPEEIECRVCVFGTKDLTSTTNDSGVLDVYFRCFFDSRKDACETDTHYRCQTGEASFNYRLIFRVMSDRKDWKLTVQCYDRDFFSSNQVIGSLQLDLAQAFNDVILTKRPLTINKDYYEPYMLKPDEKHPWVYNEDGDPPALDDTFWIPLNGKNKETKAIEPNGTVRIQIDICPKDYAEKNKVGSARDAPNVSPFLPPPVGRLSFSFNPCVMYKQMVGPKLRRKICIWFWTSLCCALFISAVCYFVPIIMGDVMAKAI